MTPQTDRAGAPAPFELTEPDDAAYAAYSANFGPYNRRHGGLEAQTFSLILRGPDGAIVAGGRGYVYLGALELRGLWVDEGRRGRGEGARLLAAIEDEARRRGASKAMLYTYSWQAEAFYAARGYRPYGRFDFPDGPYRVDMEKAL